MIPPQPLANHKIGPTPKPTAVKWIIALTWLRLAPFFLGIVLTNVFMLHFDSQWMEKFRNGFVGSLGYNPGSYSADNAAEVTGKLFADNLPALLLLVFLCMRKLMALRLAAAFSFLFDCTGKGWRWAVSTILLVLVFMPSTKAYCRPVAVKSGSQAGGGASNGPW
jgi:hypothetical protein